jgi:pyruvate dehydrogenase E2 component (dihydrolipoamide acetyltransferase)
MADIVTMPKLGFDMAEGTLVRWVVPEGGAITKGAVLAEIETDKATVEVESYFDGLVTRHLVTEGTVVPINTPIAVIAIPGEQVDYKTLFGEVATIQVIKKTDEEGKSAVATVVLAEATPAVPPAPVIEDHIPEGVRASPLARRIAAERNINLTSVKGSGPGGRITKKDIETFEVTPVAPTVTAAPVAPTLVTDTIPTEVVPLNRLRTAIGRRMTEAKQQVPHFYVTHEYDVAALLDLRKQMNTLVSDDERLSVNDYIVKAVALTLRQFPNLNASLQGSQVIRHTQINIGNAVTVEGGLLTVVCHDADRKPLKQIANEVRTMAERARQGKVHSDDIEGSTFSISNLGMFDVEHFIAIINPPEAAILAVGTAREVPVVVNGEVKPGWRMKVTISIDHRVSDGAEAARFLQALTQYLEQPLRLLI